MYPDLQLQSNDPRVFTQFAFDEQLLAPGILHSSTSAKGPKDFTSVIGKYRAYNNLTVCFYEEINNSRLFERRFFIFS